MIPVIKGKLLTLMKIESLEELKEISQGTPWCTKGDDMARTYFKKDKIYLIQYNDGRKHSLISTPDIQWQIFDRNKLIEQIGGKTMQDLYKSGIVDFVKRDNEKEFLSYAKNEISFALNTYMKGWNMESADTGEVLVLFSSIGIMEFPELVEKSIFAKIAKQVLLVRKQSQDLEKEMSEKINAKGTNAIIFYIRFASKCRLSDKNCENIILTNQNAARIYLRFLNSTGKLKPKAKKEIFEAYEKIHGKEDTENLIKSL